MKQREPVEVRSSTYRAFAIAAWVLLAALAVALVASGAGDRLAALPTFAYVAALAWAFLWRPHLVVDDEGATVVNPVVTVRVPYDALIEVSTRWALTLRTPHRSVAVFCAPQPGRFVSWRVQRRIRREGDPHERKALDRGIHVGELPGTESGDAAALIRDRWQAAIDDGRVTVGIADEVDVPRRFDVALLVTVVGGAVVALGGAWVVAALV